MFETFWKIKLFIYKQVVCLFGVGKRMFVMLDYIDSHLLWLVTVHLTLRSKLSNKIEKSLVVSSMLGINPRCLDGLVVDDVI